MESTNPPGFLQHFATTTIKNDHSTLIKTHAAYKQRNRALRRVKGMFWTLFLQPLLPAMAKKGQRDCQGLDTRTEPLIIVLFTAVWQNGTDDELVDQKNTGGHPSDRPVRGKPREPLTDTNTDTSTNALAGNVPSTSMVRRTSDFCRRGERLMIPMGFSNEAVLGVSTLVLTMHADC
ncbi:MAG: hypothetical protein L6R41_005689 [Letrouitia leprolyta]|nr:MAG: hypothetical protein L6R41_005689 [Letrouitia leprolyta]